MSHKIVPPWTWDGNAPVKIVDAQGYTICDLFPSAAEHIVPLICSAPDQARRLEVAQRLADALEASLRWFPARGAIERIGLDAATPMRDLDEARAAIEAWKEANK